MTISCDYTTINHDISLVRARVRVFITVFQILLF